MHGLAGEGQRVGVVHPPGEVVRVEHGPLPHLAKTIPSVTEHVRERSDQHAEVPVESVDPPDGVGTVVVPEVPAALFVEPDDRSWEERLETSAHGHGAGPRAPAPVRRGERLVGVHVHDVEPHVAGTSPPHDGVEVRAVVIEECPYPVHRCRDAFDLLLEQSQRVRIRQHQPRDVPVDQPLERREVDQAASVGRDLDGPVAGKRDTGRVRSVGGVGDDDLRPRVPVLRVKGPHDQRAGQLAGSTGRWLEGGTGHACNLAQCAVQPPQQLEGALDRVLRLMGVEPLEAGQPRHGLGHLRVVLHRAGPERIEPGVHPVVDLGQAGEMAHDVGL